MPKIRRGVIYTRNIRHHRFSLQVRGNSICCLPNTDGLNQKQTSAHKLYNVHCTYEYYTCGLWPFLFIAPTDATARKIVIVIRARFSAFVTFLRRTIQLIFRKRKSNREKWQWQNMHTPIDYAVCRRCVDDHIWNFVRFQVSILIYAAVQPGPLICGCCLTGHNVQFEILQQWLLLLSFHFSGRDGRNIYRYAVR